MSTEKKQATEQEASITTEEKIVEGARNFWSKNSKALIAFVAIVVIGVAGFFAYRNLVVLPKEEKANDLIFHAEKNFRRDSLQLALNGDNTAANPGFLKLINNYGGTDAGKLAEFYAGATYLKLGEFENAIKYLKNYSTSVKQVQARAYGLLGDAYAETDKKEDAVTQYKKAGTHFPEDDLFSSEYLFRAGYLLETLGKNEEAIEQYKKIKEQYPNTAKGFEIDKYLARLGA